MREKYFGPVISGPPSRGRTPRSPSPTSAGRHGDSFVSRARSCIIFALRTPPVGLLRRPPPSCRADALLTYVFLLGIRHCPLFIPSGFLPSGSFVALLRGVGLALIISAAPALLSRSESFIVAAGSFVGLALRAKTSSVVRQATPPRGGLLRRSGAARPRTPRRRRRAAPGRDFQIGLDLRLQTRWGRKVQNI